MNSNPITETMKCYSTNEEDFSHNDISEAIESLKEENDITPGKIIELWEGEGRKMPASYYVGDITDAMQDAACDDCGEYATDWDFSKEQQASLNAAVAKTVDQWATENNMHPHFYRVENVTALKVRITDDDGGYEILPEASA
ncbi:hypothetical protein JIN84_12890 [Luteolibacter yonseiensis]|uniref:Uncharacterized protein n=1 Tax=Luteolibacter yonseiensis TaxID=1144680 RepID=A0A934VBV3_9BACT|nr:hypothetical protein [Luteolibacter yonseiensis]MBK1816515.1 hypothetical protein [Luteolibacter yonseiensis]